MSSRQVEKRYEVAILGNHLATALLAAILARSGIRTVVVPALGDQITPADETTVPYTAELFLLLGSKYQIPEIAAMGMFPALPDRIRGTCGIKRNLGFLYHRPGLAQRPAEALQFNVPAEHEEWHIYRPAADAYAADIATRRGAAVLSTQAKPNGVRVDADEVSIQLVDDRVIRAEYLVSGSSDARMLPDGACEPRAAPTRHQSHLLFTHLTGVRPFESFAPLRRYKKATPWSNGTLLHVFDGGWIQLAPFGNHGGSNNGRCSVAASVDPSMVAPSASAPAQFRQVIERFPDIQRQFDKASPAEPWQNFGHWPTMAEECVGPRWFLFDRAAGRHDLLLSRGITMSLELLHATATGLLRLADTGDWAGDAMKEIGDFQLNLLDFHDRFVSAGRTATVDFELWNAYLRVWLLWSILSALSLKRARIDSEAASGPDRWSAMERFDHGQHWYPVAAGLPDLLLETLRDIESVPLGASAQEVADRIFAKLRREPFVPPLYRFGDPKARYYHFTRTRRLRMLLWVKMTAPRDFRRLLTADNVTASSRRPSGGG